MSSSPWSELDWIASLVRAFAWLCLFLALAAARSGFEGWLIARFQRRHSGGIELPRLSLAKLRDLSSAQVAVRTLAVCSALLAGGAIPLLPQVQVPRGQISFHLYGDAGPALLYALALGWLGTSLLALSQGRQPGRAERWGSCGSLLLNALPTLLVACIAIMTSSALSAQQEGSLRLDTLIDLQGAWAGWRWLGFLQPLALLLWLACAIPLRPDAQVRTTLSWQLSTLSQALLASALFLGGWQGPFVERFAWLGLLYTALKTGFVTFIWVWMWASLPRPNLWIRARATWQVRVPLAVLNLVITALIVPLIRAT